MMNTQTKYLIICLVLAASCAVGFYIGWKARKGAALKPVSREIPIESTAIDSMSDSSAMLPSSSSLEVADEDGNAHRKGGVRGSPAEEVKRLIAAQLINAFNLSEMEAQAAKQAITTALLEIEKHVNARTRIESADGIAVVITASPFTEGADVYDKMISDLEKAIGPERSRNLLALQSDDIEKFFHSFGAEARQLQISRITQGEASHFHLRDERSVILKNGKMMSIVTPPIRFSDAEKLPPDYAWLGNISPQLRSLAPRAEPVGGTKSIQFRFYPLSQ